MRNTNNFHQIHNHFHKTNLVKNALPAGTFTESETDFAIIEPTSSNKIEHHFQQDEVQQLVHLDQVLFFAIESLS